MTTTAHKPDTGAQTLYNTDYQTWELIEVCQIYADAYAQPAHRRAEKQRAQAARYGISEAAQDRAARDQYATEAALDRISETHIPEHRLSAALSAAHAYRIARATGATGNELIRITIDYYREQPNDYDPELDRQHP